MRMLKDQNQLNDLNDHNDHNDLNHLNDLNLYPLTFDLSTIELSSINYELLTIN